MIELSAYAKINLHLHSQRRRADGYHDLQTVFCHLNLCDTVQLVVRQGTIEFESQTGLSIDDDLAGRAAQALWTKVGRPELGCAIRVTKRIPSGGGLGGGSADAAAVLRGLRRLWSVPDISLATIARQLGADVPFLIHGGLALAGGIGEKLVPLSTPLDPVEVTLLFPGRPVATPTAYQWLDADGLDEDTTGSHRLDRLLTSLRIGSSDFIDAMYNAFDIPVCRRIPEVLAAFDIARALGLKPILCGSGSTVAAFGDVPIDHPDLLHFRPLRAQLIGFSGTYDETAGSSSD